MQVSLLQSDTELGQVADVMLALRPSFTKATLIEQIKLQQLQGYQLSYLSDQQQIVAVAGFVIAWKLSWGKHLYLDDLVTLPSCRSKGVGKQLLHWLEDYAKQQQCEQFHLGSGVQRFAAHRFYLRHGFDIKSHHFTKQLSN
ncbi:MULTISPECIES: GNAT family N-acetyltransferase [unclassified Agarivorans]|uniref:GNAT family N-acetyltransferase n=1 Tax=unclassified Agarivorans TaxID=2636026 RepID=UPI0026E37155|nr:MULTISPECIES: GNAT family N-acetyltransferase [unclassified Agarivorans]MDO6685525.1 GNAT family N-acetyltransferase [Agarivorans sp. 3_MG-2023]MDO6715911.1 GNAT family N-acetyltransferase [Agarivorans sp. 2_MG-2023]